MADIAAAPSTPADAIPRRANPIMQFIRSEPLGLFGFLVVLLYFILAVGAAWIFALQSRGDRLHGPARRPLARAPVRHRPVRP
ncbi:MAG: hypothetical protein V9G18_00375 [Albidovulum sp.]